MPKSREELTNISNTNRELCRILNLIWSDIKEPKASSAALHVVKLDDPRLFPTKCSDELKDTLLSVLKSEYSCSVRDHETIGFNGKVLERNIIIDWTVQA